MYDLGNGARLQSFAVKAQDGPAKLIEGQTLQLCLNAAGTRRMHMHLRGKRPYKSLGLPIEGFTNAS